MTHSIGRVTGLIFMIAISAMVGWSAEEQRIDKPASDPKREPLYQEKPLGYWLKSIRNHDDKIMLAFDAIIDLGPDAWPAVGELTRIVAEPFTPINIGVDGDDVIGAKLFNMHLRANAIDALTAIGEAAASSTVSLIQWALAVRFIPVNLGNVKNDALFVDLITMDVLERMRVAGAVARFGLAAVPTVVALLESPDGEKRKLGVAILSENTLPVAAYMLKSESCDDRKRGIAILADMWPVVAKNHLAELKSALVCAAN